MAAFFPPFLPLLEEMGPPEACNKKETDAAASVSFFAGLSSIAGPRGPRRDERLSSFMYKGHFPFVGAEFYPPTLLTALSGRTPVGAGVPDGPLYL